MYNMMIQIGHDFIVHYHKLYIHVVYDYIQTLHGSKGLISALLVANTESYQAKK